MPNLMSAWPACLQISDGSVMVSSKDGQTVVQVASYDMAIVDNSIVARQVSDSLCTGGQVSDRLASWHSVPVAKL
jgi:hypothetical protein